MALITPLENIRASNRAILGGAYFEIFIDTTLETCQARDPKGLYAKVARGEIIHFTSIDSPFEIPQNADLVVNTKDRSIEECVFSLLQKHPKITMLFRNFLVFSVEQRSISQYLILFEWSDLVLSHEQRFHKIKVAVVNKKQATRF